MVSSCSLRKGVAPLSDNEDYSDATASDATPDSATSPQAEDLLAALATRGLGPTTAQRLLERYATWEEVRSAHRDDLRGLGVKSDAIRAIRESERQYEPLDEIARARDMGVRLIARGSPEYPKALQVQDHVPPLLYVKGDLQERDALAIAIVGARRASLYGRMHAERLGFELAQAGFTVVSGLARGIDAAAHEGALKGGGRTLAVLGNGLGTVYPSEHKDLAERITQSGALISELHLDAPPLAANFPPRNRIIAALSLGVVVVEAARRSGALITARLAGEMGKEVFAIPGDIGRPQTRGAHQLSREGAKLVETLADIVEELGPLAASVQVPENETAISDPRALTLNATERAIYDMLEATPRDIDEITRSSGLSAANVASTLMVLELRQLAVSMPGKRYVRAGSFQR